VTRYLAPGGPGVRTDAAIYTGYEIPPYYDSMCAKLTVWALDWDSLLDRAERALQDISVYGVKTTIPYYQEILKSAHFQTGKFDTSFVESHPELTRYSVYRSSRNLATAIGAAVAAHMGL
jgi:pyruvate carboxylase subunit A